MAEPEGSPHQADGAPTLGALAPEAPEASRARAPDGPADGASDPSDGNRGAARTERSRWHFVGSFPFLILVALAVAILIKSFLFQAFFIPSPSMEPTLREGDRVLVNKVSYRFGDVGRRDVIVFVNPGAEAGPDRGVVGGFLHWLGEGIGVAQPEKEDYIKRVIGLGGESLEIQDETVFVNGEPLEEPYLTREAKSCNRDYGPVTVPQDALFVMGDNRCNSADSRYGLGFVPVDKVIGHAFVVIWPPSDIGGLG
jgi:signal peptidase I